MPVKGIHRKVTPRQIWDATPKLWLAGTPKPLHGETFPAYALRLRISTIGRGEKEPDKLLTALVALGSDKPTRQEYESRLTEVIDDLSFVRTKLYEEFRKD